MNFEEKAKELLCTMNSIKPPHDKLHLDKVSKGECSILRMLCENDGQMMSGDIAKAACISTARVANMIKVAEEKGLVKRQSVDGDRRRTMVVLTELGKETSEKIFLEAIDNFSKYLEYIGEEDTENLIRIFNKTKGFFE